MEEVFSVKMLSKREQISIETCMHTNYTMCRYIHWIMILALRHELFTYKLTKLLVDVF